MRFAGGSRRLISVLFLLGLAAGFPRPGAGRAAPTPGPAAAALRPGDLVSQPGPVRLTVHRSCPARAWTLRLRRGRIVDAQIGPALGRWVALILSVDGEPGGATLVCLERATGRPRWTAALGRYRAAASDGQRLYVLSNPAERKGAVRAYAWATGALAWSRPASWLGESRMFADGGRVLWSEGEVERTVAADTRTGQALWSRPGQPLAATPAHAYLWTWGSPGIDDGQHIAALEPRDGRKTQDSHFSTSIAVDYSFGEFTWAASAQRFFGVEALRGYPIGFRAFKPDLTPAWSRGDLGAYVLCRRTLVAEELERYGSRSASEVRVVGIVGLDPATGRMRWRKRQRDDALVGATATEVIVRGGVSETAEYRGIGPEAGRTHWSLRLPIYGARVVEEYLIGPREQPEGAPEAIQAIDCYRLP